MDAQIVQVHPANPAVSARQADTDAQLIELWLHGRSPATQRAYRADVVRFQRFVLKPLHSVLLADLQAFADSLAGLASASQARGVALLKSLFAFAHRLGYLQYDVARVLKLPGVRGVLSERILSEKQILRMLGDRHDDERPLERRNRVLVLLAYAAGLRVSELAGLCWRDACDRSDGDGQVTVFGKGAKTRVVRLPASVWRDMLELRAGAADDAPIFQSREGGHLDQSQVNRIVKSAAKRAKLPASVSPHWMRHAHASHALDRGAPISLVQATLGHSSVATTGRYLHARPAESSARFLPL